MLTCDFRHVFILGDERISKPIGFGCKAIKLKERTKAFKIGGAIVADEENDNIDLFITKRLFPDAKGLLTAEHEYVGDVIGSCDFVVDTNILLVPYVTGSESFDKITEIYEKLVGEERIFLPGQVAREFVKNRSSKLTELYSNLSARKSKIVKPDNKYHPILRKLNDFESLVEAEKELSESIKTYQKALSSIQDSIRNWSLNDPVSVVYREKFDDKCVWDLELDEEEIKKSISFRYKNKIPPGYKDASKSDGGIGDLMIWLTILQIGKKRKRNLIFVTGEEKADWQHRSDNRGLFPRSELVDEYRRASSGKTFHIISLSRLLEFFNASDEAVEEIKEYESDERQKEIVLDEKTLEEIECPHCNAICSTYIRRRKGSSSLPMCKNCEGRFHVHRKNDDGEVVANVSNVQQLAKEQVVSACPKCGNSEISVFLGRKRGSSATGYCEECDDRFHVHRRQDGSHFSNEW